MSALRTLPLLAVSFALLHAAAAAQQRPLSGRVFPGQEGLPFAGAAIRVMDTGEVVCADSQGFFSVDVPLTGARLRVTPVGFPPQELTVAPGQVDVALLLGEYVVALEAVEVVGYASSYEGAAALAQSSLRGAELERVPARSLEGAMQGKVAGARVEATSGEPGGAYRIVMRGVNTIFGSAEPLVIVDGVTIATSGADSGVGLALNRAERGASNRLADLDPKDVDRVEFLRGAAAASLYGSRAANGVVLITTKRGKPQPKADPESLRCFRAYGR